MMNSTDLQTQAALAQLRDPATGLHLHGLLAHWAEVMAQPEQAA